MFDHVYGHVKRHTNERVRMHLQTFATDICIDLHLVPCMSICTIVLIDMCIDVFMDACMEDWMDMCIENAIDMCIDDLLVCMTSVHVDMHAMCVDIDVAMRTDTCMDTHIDAHPDVSMHVCMDICIDLCLVCSHAYGHVERRAYRHLQRKNTPVDMCTRGSRYASGQGQMNVRQRTAVTTSHWAQLGCHS